MKNVRYTGRLAVVRDGYGFIALTTVKKGTDAHGLETKHDIFVHSDDCAIGLKLEEGVLLSFECEIDQRRDGCFRAVNVTVAAETALVPLTGAVIAGLTITKHEIAYHSPMKAVAEDQVALARTNAPLSGLPRDEATVELPDDPTGLSRALMDYLATQFPQMRGVGISYEIEGFDESTQDARINDEATALSELCMLDQANELLEAYARFKAVRRLLQLIGMYPIY